MRVLLLPLLLATAGCAELQQQSSIRPMFVPQPVEEQGPVVERRVALGDPALDFISVGASPDLEQGQKRERDVIQDSTLREFNIALSTSAEQMDNWWAQTGAALIPAPD